MLEVTLLKVRHAGRREACKLLAYIQSCDIFSPEDSLCTQDRAVRNEHNWSALLSSPRMSRSSLQKLIRQLSTQKGHFSDETEYHVALKDYLYRNNKPLFYFERFTPEAAEFLRLKKTSSFTFDEGSLLHLEDGNFDKFFELQQRFREITMEIADARDRQMGAVISTAETELRVRYEHLREIEPLRLCGIVGSFHRPERYITGVPVTTIDLLPLLPTSIGEDLCLPFSRGVPIEKLRTEELRAGMERMDKKNPRYLPSQRLRTMNYDELVKHLKR